MPLHPELLAWRLPVGFNWALWVGAFDQMQDGYVPQRRVRFQQIAESLQKSCAMGGAILDLGCGTGTLADRILATHPQVKVIGVDHDPTLLRLAEERLRRYESRIHFLQEDLRQPDWAASLTTPITAAVSATALHWLSAEELRTLYSHLADLLQPNGVFLNSDHVAPTLLPAETPTPSDSPSPGTREAWETFWQDYAQALGQDLTDIQSLVTGKWEGVEEGLPLSWHFEALQQAGFHDCDCIWRDGVNALYGARR